MAKSKAVKALLEELEAARERVATIEKALEVLGSRAIVVLRTAATKSRRKMSAAQRKAVSRRMKARWASMKKAGKKNLGK